MPPTQTCLSRHYGRRAKTTSSFLRGFSCCPAKTSPSDTSSKRMSVALLPVHHLLCSVKWAQTSYNPFKCFLKVQGPQSGHLHEGPECSFPAREDRPCSRPADLLPARRAHEESVCVSWEWTGELECCCVCALLFDTNVSSLGKCGMQNLQHLSLTFCS